VHRIRRVRRLNCGIAVFRIGSFQLCQRDKVIDMKIFLILISGLCILAAAASFAPPETLLFIGLGSLVIGVVSLISVYWTLRRRREE
jgi:hypothetical protein